MKVNWTVYSKKELELEQPEMSLTAKQGYIVDKVSLTKYTSAFQRAADLQLIALLSTTAVEPVCLHHHPKSNPQVLKTSGWSAKSVKTECDNFQIL